MPNFPPNKIYALFGTTANKKLLAELAADKAETILFPAILTKAIDIDNYKTELENLDKFDWLIFPDVYTAEYFIEAIDEIGLELFELDEKRICAYGESVADRLRFSQIHSDVIPPSNKTAFVLQQIKDYVFDVKEFTNLQFLILIEQNSPLPIADELLKLGSAATIIPIYSFEMNNTEELTKLKALLKGGAIDEFIFSLPEDVLHLAQMFPAENLSDLLSGISLNAVNESARKSLQEFRLID